MHCSPAPPFSTLSHVIDGTLNWTVAPLIWVALFASMLLAMEVGRRVRVRDQHVEAGQLAGFGAVQAAVFGLMGLMIAFTFSGAAARFDQRRDLVVQEANNIGTAYLRIALLPEPAQAPLRDKFRQYVETRLDTYRAGPNASRINQLLQQTAQQQTEIWKMAGDGIGAAANPMLAALIVPPLNNLFDIVTTRTAATQMHPPAVVWFMLGGLALVCSMLVGYDLGGLPRNWLHLLTFAFLFSLTLYVIVDMEYPRLGFIRVDAMDRVMEGVRDSMP
jgi:hypothetical protein